MPTTKPWRFALAAAGLLLTLFGAALLIGQREREPAVTNAVKSGSAATGSVIYAASFVDLNGKNQPLAQWGNRLLVINFWASWCPPCIEEIPTLIQMQQKYATRGLQIVGIAADSRLNAANFSEKLGINYPVFPDEAQAIAFSKRLGNQFGLLPFTIVLNRSGDIVMTKTGVVTEAELTRLVEQNLS